MKHVIVFVFGLLMSFVAYSSNKENDLWLQANNSFQQKNFEQAAVLYEQIASSKPNDASLYFNLGNTYYKLNKIGLAVLNYQRALHIQPSFQDAKDNLELTMSRIPNRIQLTGDIFFIKWWKGITASSLSGFWAAFSLFLFLSSIGLLTMQRLGKISFNISKISLVGLLLCSLFLLFAFSSANRKSEHNTAVVMQHDAPLLIEASNGKTYSYIPEGTIVTIDDEQKENLQVILPDGKKGWMNKQLVERI
jgi:tetratricopeptide (TPR) repeat protein